MKMSATNWHYLELVRNEDVHFILRVSLFIHQRHCRGEARAHSMTIIFIHKRARHLIRLRKGMERCLSSPNAAAETEPLNYDYDYSIVQAFDIYCKASFAVALT